MAPLAAGVAGSIIAGYAWQKYHQMPVDLEGRVVVVTGAGAGVGQLCAVAFARQGCRVVLWDVNEEGLVNTRALVLAAAPACLCWTQRVDVGDHLAVYAAAAEAQALCAPAHVSILVNNAGVVSGRRFLETDDTRILATFRVNALAHMWTCKAFLPKMLEARLGHVVSVASVAGLIAAPNIVDYSASKFAAVGFAEGLRKELRAQGADFVQTSLLCPAFINTELFKGFRQPLVPALEPQHVADEIVDAVRYGRQMVVLPKLADTSLINALLPVRVSDTLWRWLGHGECMAYVDTAHAEKTINMVARSRL